MNTNASIEGNTAIMNEKPLVFSVEASVPVATEDPALEQKVPLDFADVEEGAIPAITSHNLLCDHADAETEPGSSASSVHSEVAFSHVPSSRAIVREALGRLPAWVSDVIAGKNFAHLPTVDYTRYVGKNKSVLDYIHRYMKTQLSDEQWQACVASTQALGGHFVLDGMSGSGRSSLCAQMMLPTLLLDENNGEEVVAHAVKAVLPKGGMTDYIPPKASDRMTRRRHAHLILCTTDLAVDDVTTKIQDFVQYQLALWPTTKVPCVLRRGYPEMDKSIFFADAHNQLHGRPPLGSIWMANDGGRLRKEVYVEYLYTYRYARPSFTSHRRPALWKHYAGYTCLEVMGFVENAKKYDWIPTNFEKCIGKRLRVLYELYKQRDYGFDKMSMEDIDEMNHLYYRLRNIVTRNAQVHVGTPSVMNNAHVAREIHPILVIVEDAFRIPEAVMHEIIARYTTNVWYPTFVHVGDSRQLDDNSTVNDETCAHNTKIRTSKAHASISMMRNLMLHGFPTCRLTVSERSIPAITNVISKICYGGELTSSPRMAQSIDAELVASMKQIFNLRGPRNTITVNFGGERARVANNSTYNMSAIKTAQWILIQCFLKNVDLSRVLYIYTYSAQGQTFESMLLNSLPQALENADPGQFAKLTQPVHKLIRHCTFDSSSGREGDIVIVDPVQTHRMGFLTSLDRNIVALTRARQILILLADLSSLAKMKAFSGPLRELWQQCTRAHSVHTLQAHQVKKLPDLFNVSEPEHFVPLAKK